jgi:hypothetical protein
VQAQSLKRRERAGVSGLRGLLWLTVLAVAGRGAV